MTIPAAPEGLLRIGTAPLALPSGLRDLLPPRAQARRATSRAILEHFERYGYQLVVPPAFEREDVVARGLSARSRGDLVRFLEPETGEVVVLRPDMTPQIARIAATRYRDTPGPVRLMYEGSVVRKPRGRARRHRQIAQAGVECIGWADTAADVEVLRAVGGALTAAGLSQWKIELGHAAIGSLLLADVPDSIRESVTEALGSRDVATLTRLLGASFGPSSPMRRAIDLAGGVEVVDRADALLSGAAFRQPLRELRDVIDGLTRFGLGDRVLVDLGEIRGHGYYTGTSFQILAEGPGEAIGSGGRYDSLLERYGAARPATGCALDLDHVEWALGYAGVTHVTTVKRVLVGGEPLARSAAAEARRARGDAVSESFATSADEIAIAARAGGHDEALLADATGVQSLELSSTRNAER